MLVDIAARIILMPVLLGQAFFVRGQAGRLPEPIGDKVGVRGQGPKLRLLIVGDSSAAGVGVKDQSDALLGQLCQRLGQRFEVHFRLVAQNGAKTSDALRWLHELPAAQYDVAVCALGINDVTKLTTRSRFQMQQAALMDSLTNDHQAKLILVSDVPPIGQFPLLSNPLRWVLSRQGKRFSRVLRNLIAMKDRAQLLEFDMSLDPSAMADDGFHPGAAAYAHWAESAHQAIITHQASLDLT